jgi:hypothetical protein
MEIRFDGNSPSPSPSLGAFHIAVAQDFSPAPRHAEALRYRFLIATRKCQALYAVVPSTLSCFRGRQRWTNVEKSDVRRRQRSVDFAGMSMKGRCSPMMTRGLAVKEGVR